MSDHQKYRFMYRICSNFARQSRNKFLSLCQEHPKRNLFYNLAVNSNAFKGYGDGDNERRLFQAPAGYIHDPAKKAIAEAGSLEANIFSKKPIFKNIHPHAVGIWNFKGCNCHNSKLANF